MKINTMVLNRLFYLLSAGFFLYYSVFTDNVHSTLVWGVILIITYISVNLD